MTGDAQDELFPALATAPVDPQLTSLARRLPSGVRLGTSTWSFPGWRGLVYDADYDETVLARIGLVAYAAHPLLRTVGVDRSFYTPLSNAALQRFARQGPADFRFLMKAHAALTTPKSASRPAFLQAAPQAFLDAEYARRVVIEPARLAWGDKLGVVLFQFSPLGPRVLEHRARLLERLADFLHALPRGITYAFEWRDAEILGADYHAMLASEGGVHGLCSHPRMPPVTEQGESSTVAPLVVRWLLRRDRSYEAARAAYAPFDRLQEPDPDTRGQIAQLVQGAVAQGREAMVIINNKAEGSAPLGVAALATALAGGQP